MGFLRVRVVPKHHESSILRRDARGTEGRVFRHPIGLAVAERRQRFEGRLPISQKREFFKSPPETIGYFAPRMPKIGARRLVANSQKPAICGPFCEYQGQFPRVPDCLAGDAVLIAPVSRQIPCQQGILQGILRFRGCRDRFCSKKPLRRSRFSRNSLRK
jgi:hypothetical protein